MKKLLLLLITLITFTNASYASFPVSDTLKVRQDTLQTEEMTMQHETLEVHDSYSVLSIILSLFGYFIFLLDLFSPLRTQLVIILIVWILAIVLGLIGLSKKKWLSILGFLLPFLGFLILNSFVPIYQIIF